MRIGGAAGRSSYRELTVASTIGLVSVERPRAQRFGDLDPD
jgi:hypothetical protein